MSAFIEKQLSEYQMYLCGGVSTTEIRLSTKGVIKLLGDTISELVDNELGLTYRGNGIWATDFCEHKRKILQLFWLNPLYATFKWGWCFDFIPKRKGRKLSYIRTDKQIDSHIFEVSADFVNNTGDRKKTMISSREKVANDFESTISIMQRKYVDSFAFLLPTIKAYFDSTDSYQGIIDDVNGKLSAPYYCFANPEMKVVKVYIKFFLNEKDEALDEFAKIIFDDEDVQEQYLKNLKEFDIVSEKK